MIFGIYLGGLYSGIRACCLRPCVSLAHLCNFQMDCDISDVLKLYGKWLNELNSLQVISDIKYHQWSLKWHGICVHILVLLLINMVVIF